MCSNLLKSFQRDEVICYNCKCSTSAFTAFKCKGEKPIRGAGLLEIDAPI